jgi:hypothetical protein
MRKAVGSLKWNDVRTRQTALAARAGAGEEGAAGLQQTEPPARG